ncbi:MAG: cysteine dioxygenase [Thermoanaerobaculia bacterium]
MNQTDFAGRERLIAMLDDAVRTGDDATAVSAVRRGLESLAREGAIELSEEIRRPLPDHYARRLLYRSEDLGYTVIAMTWGPEQETPLHDHAGLWCVDGVWSGRLEVVQYELLEERDERFRFEPRDTIHAGAGSAGSLIPPYEYHTIANAQDTPSVTVHVYAGDMERCSIFLPEGEGWYRREEKRLRFDA